jgi:hypothetical protein
MPVTVRGTDILFNDSTTQSSAGLTLANTSNLGIGSVVMALNFYSSALPFGSDTSGAGLFRSSSQSPGGGGGFNVSIFDAGDLRNRTSTFTANGITYTSLASGTWRLMGPSRHPGTIYAADSYGNLTYQITVSLYMRVA